MWRKSVGLLFGAALSWGLFLYGATEPQTHYRLFLFLLIPTLIALWRLPLKPLRKTRFLALTLVGLFLFAEVSFQPTLAGRGYIIAALGWLALFLTLVLTAESRNSTRALCFFLILVGAAEAFYGLVQSLGGLDYIGEYHRNLGRLATGTLINRNHFAGLMNMTIPLAIGGLFASFARRGFKEKLRSEAYAWVWIILLSCSFMGLAIFLSLSRAGTLTLASTLVFLTLMLTLRRTLHQRGRHNRSLSGLAGWILLFTVLGLACWVGLDALLSRFGMVDGAADERATVYRQTLGLIAENVLSGVGPGMYRWRFRPYQSLDASLLYDYAHNDYLQSAAEWGIPAALLFWGFVLRRLYRSMRVFFQSRDHWRQGIALGCSGTIFSILLHSFVDFNLQIPGNLMVFCMILGLSWSLDDPRITPIDANQQG